MKRLFLSIALLSAFVIHADAQKISGTWHGEMQLNSLKLNLVLHLDGDSVCTIDSPDQGAKGIAGTVKELTAEKVDVQFPMLMAAYTAELKEGKLVGTFKQRGFTVPLTLEPGDLVRQRPQTPQPPFPYETREVKIAVPSPYGGETERGYTLSGTLTLPVPLHPASKVKGARTNGKNITPSSLGVSKGGASLCLLLVTGSGLQDRDETLFDHKPFAVIADYLARHGIATLRYDDRGFGKSTGDAANCTTADFAKDAEAGIRYLRSLKASPMGGGSEGTPLFSKVGILGHSEGGSIAFMLGARQLVDCIVALAAPGIKGDTLLVEQTNALLQLNGQPANMTLQRLRLTMAMQLTNPWYEFFVEYDPSTDIAATRCPVLALNGSLDCQVLPESNLTAIRQLSTLNSPLDPKGRFRRETKKELSTKEYPGLNHLFQHAPTGAATEYGNIEETISEEVLRDIVTWLQTL